MGSYGGCVVAAIRRRQGCGLRVVRACVGMGLSHLRRICIGVGTVEITRSLGICAGILPLKGLEVIVWLASSYVDAFVSISFPIRAEYGHHC